MYLCSSKLLIFCDVLSKSIKAIFSPKSVLGEIEEKTSLLFLANKGILSTLKENNIIARSCQKKVNMEQLRNCGSYLFLDPDFPQTSPRTCCDSGSSRRPCRFPGIKTMIELKLMVQLLEKRKPDYCYAFGRSCINFFWIHD